MLRAMGVPLFEPAALRRSAPEAAAAPPPLSPATPPTTMLRQAATPVAVPGAVAPAAPATPAAAVVATPITPASAPGVAPGAVPAREAIATLDWPALRAAVASCQACALSRSRQQAVFGSGHARAHWMIVGEAPGEQEDLQGEAFVGPSGQLLDHMLRALGLTREAAPPERQVFIANTIKCRPPRNRNPEPAETAQCAPFLARQIALVQPRIIVAMGRFAAQALLGNGEALGRLRGRVHAYQGVPLVVTYHPAYLLRTPADKARAWEDLCLAASVVEAA